MFSVLHHIAPSSASQRHLRPVDVSQQTLGCGRDAMDSFILDLYFSCAGHCTHADICKSSLALHVSSATHLSFDPENHAIHAPAWLIQVIRFSIATRRSSSSPVSSNSPSHAASSHRNHIASSNPLSLCRTANETSLSQSIREARTRNYSTKQNIPYDLHSHISSY